MVIGEQISRLRHLRRLTQDQLAAASGVSVDVIRRLEQGQRNTARLATLSAIATALGAQLSVILRPAADLHIPTAAWHRQHPPGPDRAIPGRPRRPRRDR